MWAPRNPLARADGVNEDVQEPRTYLEHRLDGNFRADKVDALLEAAPHMVGFFQSKTSLQFTPGTWIADIHGKTPGAGTGHRSVGPKPINKRSFNKELRAKMPKQLYETSFLGMGIMAGPDLQKFLRASRGNVKGLFHAAWRVGLHLWDLATHREGMQLVNGTALIGRLMKSADDAGVDIRVNAAARQLLQADDGRVAGAVVETPKGELRITASRGTVLAAGGFPNDRLRRVELFPHHTGAEHHTLARSSTTGDGLSLGESAGGHIDRSLASAVAWCPVSLVPYRHGKVGVFPHIADRGKPGIIGVLRNGRRFVNEADGYHDYVLGMLGATPADEPVESWLIADSTFQRRYPLGMSKPWPVPTWPYVRNGYLVKGNTLEELARKCGIDPAGLVGTVARFNENANRGEDPDFHRGETQFNRYSGDPTVTPNPSLAPIWSGPFYAVRVLPGSFGTFMGLETDAQSRVVDAAGEPIAGLYAVGTDQASVFGGHYPSGGINIGPAMTFGYIAGRHLVGAADYEDAGGTSARR